MPAPPDRRIEKVSLGAENFLEWEKNESTAEVCKNLKKKDFFIIALEQHSNSKNIFQQKIDTKKIAIILGNEVEGISNDTLKLADKILEIPMHGKKSSLNVSVAAGICFFALR